MADDAELFDRLDHSLRFIFEEVTRRTPGGRVVRQDGLLLAIGAVPSPVIVNTILPEAPVVDPAAFPRALAIYQAAGNHPSIMTRDHLDGALRDHFTSHGYRSLLSLPGMVLDARLPDELAPSGVSIHEVVTEGDRQLWVEGNLHGFGEDDLDREAMLSACGTLGSLTGEPVTSWYAMADGRGVAAAMAVVDPETSIGVVGWVGTDVAYRRRGIGRAVTRAATNAAFDMGATLLSLQASPMGYPVYERMGFRTVTSYRVWLPPDGSAG